MVNRISFPNGLEVVIYPSGMVSYIHNDKVICVGRGMPPWSAFFYLYRCGALIASTSEPIDFKKKKCTICLKEYECTPYEHFHREHCGV